MPSMPTQTNRKTRNPLDGVTLETIVTTLSVTLGWEALAAAVPIRCFTHEPSVKSSLTFLRRTAWARAKVEALYLRETRIAQNKHDVQAP